MSHVNLGRPIAIPKDKNKEFKELSSIPDYAWKTIILAVVSVGAVLLIDINALMGNISYLSACLAVSIIYYWYFSVIHDSIHRSISKNKKLNDFIGQLAASTFAPYATLPIFRWAHMEHHRFTNDEGDPDSYMHGSWWQLAFRWMTIDVYYALRVFSAGTEQSKKAMRESVLRVSLGMVFIVAVIAAGYGYEFFMLVFLPSRIAFIGIGFSFFWLPHSHWPDDKEEISQAKNYTLATTVRLGYEGILNILLQYQNYHLIHHLWPTTPFYNNEKVWKLLEPELRERDLAVTRNFDIYPIYEFANSRGETKNA